MRKKEVRVKGIGKGYIFNKKHKDQISSPKTQAQLLENAWLCVHMSAGGELFIPGRQFVGAMIKALRMCEMKLNGSMDRAERFYASAVNAFPNNGVPSEFIPFIDKKGKPLKKKSIQIYDDFIYKDLGKSNHKIWTFIPEWYCDFIISYPERIEEGFIMESLENAAIFCGVGGLRNRGYGRFEILS